MKTRTKMVATSTTTLKNKIKELTDLLLQYNKEYYQNHKSPVTDEQYDKMLKELEELEHAYPDYALPYSPTQNVGSDKNHVFTPVEHLIPMQSLENTYNEPEMMTFMTSMQKAFPKVEFVTEFKIDGLSISCVYQDGKLIQASTRGNGSTGDDVTRNAQYIQDIPKELKFQYTVPHLFEIRGEVFMTYKDFEATNDLRDKKGLPLLANPRNAASGTLKTLDPSVFKERKLHALFYHVATADELPISQDQMFYLFDQIGVPHAPFYLCKNQSEVLQAIGKIAQLRPQLPYPTDGAVVKVNDFSMREKIGSTSKYPRWAKAYKFSAEQARTTVKDITIQVGRTGVLTPVAELEPVALSGSIVKRATLHNSDMIRKLDVRIGDTVLLEKAGEVIPHILCSIEHQSGSKPYYLFEQVHGKCPSCGCSIVRKEDEVAWKCVNKHCPARIEEQILYGASKPALDIKGLGRAIVHALIQMGKTRSLLDLFELTIEDLVHLPLDDKSYVGVNGEKIWHEIQAARNKTLDRWLVAFGIPGVGPAVAKEIAHALGILQIANFDRVPMTPAIAENFNTYMKDKDNLIYQTIQKGIHPTMGEVSSGKLFGKTFVITGKLSRPRDAIEKLITENNGKVTGSVSKSTTFLIQGEDDRVSSKTKKAKELGIPILTEDQFLSLIQSSQPGG